MATHVPSDTEAFHQFITAYIESGGVDTSPEDLLKLWRLQEQDRAETLEDIQQGLQDYKDGKAEPLSEAFDDIRRWVT
jgi:hypothetical protein